MPPVSLRRSTSLPTVISLSKLLHLVPAAISARHAKRNDMWATGVASAAVAFEGEEPEEAEYLAKLILSMGLVLLGGVFAGLTLALMGSDDLNLRVLAASSSDPKVRKQASKVLRLLARGRHWVLVVLLLGNVIVNESLPIFLDEVFGGGLMAVIVSTIMIVIFGEVIPQAVCVRYGLAIGGACAPMVHALMVIFAPIAWPIAKLLDYALGHDVGHTYKKAELKSFLQFHREGEEPLRDDEIVILNGVLSLNERRVDQIMTPIDDCLILPSDKVLDHDAVDQILISGFSRIPVHEPGQPDNFIGMLLVKRLITYNPDDEKPVSKFPLLPLPEAKPDLNCFQALDYFQTGRAHLLLVSNTPGQRGGALGIISLEDLIEEIIGEEIIDETDRYEDNQSKKMAQRRATRDIMRGIIERQRVINSFSRRPSRNRSRNESPAPPREGVLVQISETAMVAEPTSMRDVKKADPDNLGVISNSPHADIVENMVGSAKSSGVPDPVQTPQIDLLDQTHDADVNLDGESPPANGRKETKSSEAESEDTVKAGAADAADASTGSTDSESTEATDNTDTKDNTDGQTAKDANNKGANNDSKDKTTSQQNTKSKSKSKRGRGKGKKKAQASIDMTEPFPTPAAYAAAALAFVAKYGTQRSGPGADPGPARTNAGWTWRTKTDKYRGEQGYLWRHTTLWVDTTTDPSATDPSMPDELELELEPNDDAAVAHAAPRACVEVDLSVVYAPTYRVPMLCLRVWDEHGAPLPLDAIVHHLVRAAVPENVRADALLLPGAPFPLLQQTEQPVTGEMVWSVHPCEVRGAVAEVLGAERGGVELEAGEGSGDLDIGEGKEEGEEEGEEEDDVVAQGVRWLEAWFMLSDGVVDLTV